MWMAVSLLTSANSPNRTSAKGKQNKLPTSGQSQKNFGG